MSDARQRFYAFLYDLDRGLNALGGGDPNETVSGTLGRAVLNRKRWAKPLAALVDAAAWLIARQKDHCRQTADDEARVRMALATLDPS